MAYYNDASFHPTSSTVRESDPSPFLGRSSASSTEESNTNTLREPVERSPAKTPSRPTADHPDYWDRDGSFIPTLAQELPSLKSFMLRGPVTPSPRSVSTVYQPDASPTRTGAVHLGQFQPYGTYGCGNAEAGPSTLALPRAPYIVEEGKLPVSKRTSPPRANGRPCPYREKRKNGERLCEWVQRHKKAADGPTLNSALAVAVGIISRSCPLIYDEPFLVKYKQRKPKEVQRDAKTVTKLARSERTREKERELYRELSRYFQVKKEGKPWNTTSLLVTVIEKLESLLPETPQ